MGTDQDITTFFAIIAGTGPSTYPVSLSDNRFGFRGYWWDDHLKLYHVRNRVYDPASFRWLQPDPAGYVDGLNLYAYCNGDPINTIDSDGRFLHIIIGSAVGAAIGGISNAIHGDDIWKGIVSGGAFGAIAAAAPGPAGAAAGAAVSNLIDQFWDNAVNDRDQTIDVQQLAISAAVGAVLGKVAEWAEPYVNKAVGWVGKQISSLARSAWESLPRSIQRGGQRLVVTLANVVDTLLEALKKNNNPKPPISPAGATAAEETEAAALKPYGEGQGHHIPAKSAFRGAKNYDPDTAPAIPKSELERLRIPHIEVVTPAQRQLYTSFAQTGKRLTWDAMEEIETEALIRGGMSPGMARATVRQAIKNLIDSGVCGPERIPWQKP